MSFKFSPWLRLVYHKKLLSDIDHFCGVKIQCGNVSMRLFTTEPLKQECQRQKNKFALLKQQREGFLH